MKKRYTIMVLTLFTLAVLTLAGCAGSETPTPDFWAAESSVLDRDGTDGYSGDYVLLYSPITSPGKLSTGSPEGIQKGAAPFGAIPAADLPVDAALYAEPDPFVTDDLRTLQKSGGWAVGDQKIFYIKEMPSREIAFQLTAAGERCCVWSPVNSAYGPMETVDSTYSAAIAAAVDDAVVRLEELFGEWNETIHVLCHDLNLPEEYGYTTWWDLYDTCYTGADASIEGNGLPMIHVNTAPLLTEDGDFATLRNAAVHEIAHLMTVERLFPDGYLEGFVTNGDHQNFYMDNISSIDLLGELLAMAAEETLYPGAALERVLPWWYANGAELTDMMDSTAECYLKSGASVLQSGGTLFRGIATREDKAALLLLAHFAENRGGVEIFPEVLATWQEMGCTGDAVQAVWTSLGYTDHQTFFEEFLLSVLLHDSSFANGKYRLEPFNGREGEDPFALLRPIVSESQFSLQPGGFAVFRTAQGSFSPADNAGEGLVCIGITRGISNS